MRPPAVTGCGGMMGAALAGCAAGRWAAVSELCDLAGAARAGPLAASWLGVRICRENQLVADSWESWRKPGLTWRKPQANHCF